MAKKKYKSQVTDIPLADNVRLLKSGAWGYVYEGKAIFKSADVYIVNSFSEWVKNGYYSFISGKYSKWSKDEILKEASRIQKLKGEPKILPQCHLCDMGTWRVEGNNYEAQTKIPKG